MNMQKEKKVAVIGAGASGLVLARHLMATGIRPVIFERNSESGGIWTYDPEGTLAERPAYANLRANSSRKVMGFKDFPFPGGVGDFPTREEVCAYLEAYRNTFDILPHIRFNTTVNAIRRNGDGEWSIICSDGQGETGFCYVVVCSGQYHRHAIPEPFNSKDLINKVTHSSLYRDPESFSGTHPLVVGLGNSGADIAAELSTAGLEVAISVPSPTWIIPRYIDGLPYDYHLTNLCLRHPLKVAAQKFQCLVEREYEHRGIDVALLDDLLKSGKMDFQRSRLTVSDQLAKLLAAREIQIFGKMAACSDGQLIDETGKICDCDRVVLANGFNPTFAFLDTEQQPFSEGKLSLFRHIFHPNCRGLAFMGMCGIVGAIFPAIEMQARWIVRMATGRTILPSNLEMQDSVKTHLRTSIRHQLRSNRVMQIDYMETLAWELGLGDAARRIADLDASMLKPVTADDYVL